MDRQGDKKEHINIARLVRNGRHFEIVIDPDKAASYIKGESVELDDVLLAWKVFSDAKKGMVVSDHELKEVFSTSDINKIAEIILHKGEVQLNADYRRKEREEKRRRIVEMIHENAIDPGTNAPHPASRIEAALEEARVIIDERKSADEQLNDVVKRIRAILPLRFETKKLTLIIPASFSGKAYGIIKGLTETKSEEWLNDGSLRVKVEATSGISQELIDRLNEVTHGDLEVKEDK